MINRIIRRFILDYENVTDKGVRESYAVLSGILGLICNLALFLVKLFIGLSLNSVAVLSDAFNNFSDLGSSLMVIIGIKLSHQPPDHEHPFGHGRMEYVGALVVAFIILVVSFQLLHSSFLRILQPQILVISPVLLVVLLGTGAVKLWMFSYNRYIGRIINSSINQAAAWDSLNDVIATTGVTAGVILNKYLPIPMDGLIGLGISIFIALSGLAIARSAIYRLLGQQPDSQLIGQISAIIADDDQVISFHDLKLHDYGPGRITGSLHVEVPDHLDIIQAHTMIDQIEQRIEDELGVEMVIHIDPVDETVL